jgi:hypothetical protein
MAVTSFKKPLCMECPSGELAMAAGHAMLIKPHLNRLIKPQYISKGLNDANN